ERDTVLCHHLTKTPFHEFHDLPIETISIKERLGDLGITLSFGQAQSPCQGLSVLVCEASGGPFFGSLFGFGCDYDIGKARNSALFECLINAVAILSGDHSIAPLSIEEFCSLHSTTALDHQRVHFSKRLIET